MLQSHGTKDPILPYALGTVLKNLFESNGMKLDFISFDGGHEIPPEAIAKFMQLIIHATL